MRDGTAYQTVAPDVRIRSASVAGKAPDEAGRGTPTAPETAGTPTSNSERSKAGEAPCRTRSSRPTANRSAQCRTKASTALRGTHTPLGAPVDPDVNKIDASSVDRIGGIRSRGPSSEKRGPSQSAGASRRTVRTDHPSPSTRARLRPGPPDAIRRLAPLRTSSSRIAGTGRCSSRGTATAPAAQMPSSTAGSAPVGSR